MTEHGGRQTQDGDCNAAVEKEMLIAKRDRLGTVPARIVGHGASRPQMLG